MKTTYTYIKILILFACIISTQHLSPQNNNKQYYFKSFNRLNGLSQNTVTAIIQDKKGFMWLGTKDGLNRFDGLSFRVFKHEKGNKNGIGNNFVSCLFEDSEGAIWTGTDDGLYIYYPEREVFERFDKKSLSGTTIEKNISMIDSDKQGRVWIAVEAQGLFCYDKEKDELLNFDFSDKQIKSNVKCFTIDDSGTIWIGFFGDGLYYSIDGLKTLTPFLSDGGVEIFQNDVIAKIERGAYNCLYIGAVKGGIKELNLTTRKVRNLLHTDETGEPVYVRTLIMLSDNELGIATESGVYIYNLRSNKYVHLKSSLYDPYSLSDNAIYSMYKDREDGLWIGSYFGGLNYFPKQYSYFEKYYETNSNYHLRGQRIREFLKDNDGTIWIGTEDGGLNNFDPKTGAFRFFEPSKAFTNIHGLCLDGDNLWIGTFSKGLKVYNKKTGGIKTYTKGDTANSLNDNSVFAIYKTSTGDIYLGTIFGLHRYNRATDDFTRIPELNGKFIYDIKEDSHGNMWLATYANGAYKYDVNTKKWTNYMYSESDEKSVAYRKVLSVFEDSKRQIWLTTQGGGICKFNPENETFTRFDSRQGLPNDVVYQIVEDSNGLFWLTTNSGLVQLDPATKEMKVYTVANGLLGNQFNYRSGFMDNDGKIYFGSIDGFIAFDPKTFTENNYIPPVVITDFQIFNKKILAGAPGSPLKKSITFSDAITLNADQNSFSFRLAALSYQAPQMNQIMYRLDGFDSDWISVDLESPVVTYSNLPYGDYTFRVKASNSDGVWNKEELVLNIEILPPFYLTAWAFCIYALVIASSILYIISYNRKRSASRQRHQMEKFEQEKEREKYNSQIEFFTNVAHEIRTPLTLIKGPLESIIIKNNLAPDVKEDLSIMSQNTNRLLDLSNQLLDFRETESREFMLNFARCDISAVLMQTYQRFTSLAREKGLDFTIELSEKEFYAYVDREAFIKIISNLFNNALKYSHRYIHVYMDTDTKGQFSIRVVNDGIIVPDNMRENIFKAFVRYTENNASKPTTGTGIGLALARSLAELHKGSLQMEKSSEQNIFCLTLPVEQTIHAISDITEDCEEEHITTEPNQAEEVNTESKPVILVVEDNPDMLAFIIKQLKSYYTVLSAKDGKEALAILDTNYIQLIISDVMMPNMDGFELSRTIKSDLNYSHVPIILLTAKTNMQSKIEGLETGADAYIEKPFSVEYLLANISNLLHNREKLWQSFSKSPFIASHTVAISKADEDFLLKLHEIISANLENPEFSMEDIAEKLNMSQSSFYRKIKGTLDLSPNDYLRLERLKKAAQLLKEGKYQINEVCYMVGFSSTSYFSKCFHKQFGVLPKDFQ